MKTFHPYVTKKSHKLLNCWVDELKIEIKVSNPRKTKLGDFKVINGKMSISINNDLNRYSFLITLVHEIAHAFVFKKYHNSVRPHSRSWQLTFKSLLINFLTPDYFPEDILRVLSRHIIKPKASTFSDLELVNVLRKYDNFKSHVLSQISVGQYFKNSSGRIFIKGERLRKRYKCIDFKSGKIYLFHPFTPVIKE